MSERVPIYLAGQAAYVVTTSRGRMFRCSLETVGTSKPELRWIFRDTNRRYVGPPATAARYLDELQALVEEWWRVKCASGQAGMDAARMRAKLIGGDN